MKTRPLMIFLYASTAITLIPLISNASQDCENQFLRVSGNSPQTLMPGQNHTLFLVSSSGKKQASLKITSKKINGGVVVSGEIRNTGKCSISIMQPVKLHPISNGLPLGWHSLPDGMAANPTLQAGEKLGFSKEYSKEYAGGFNLSIGSWNLSPSPENTSQENASNSCSDHAMAKQLETIAQKETNGISGICDSAQAMNRVNAAALSILDKCSSNTPDRKSLRQEIQQSIAESNQSIRKSCDTQTGIIETAGLSDRSSNLSNPKRNIASCSTHYKVGSDSFEYIRIFEDVTKNKVKANYGSPGELTYAYHFGFNAQFSNQIDPLKDKAWRNWSKSDWGIVISEVEKLRSHHLYHNSDKRNIENYIQDIKCYSSMAVDNQ